MAKDEAVSKWLIRRSGSGKQRPSLVFFSRAFFTSNEKGEGTVTHSGF